MEKLLALLAWCGTVLGIEFDGKKKVKFTEEQVQDLNAAAKKDNFAELFEAAFNQALDGEAANAHIIEFMQSQADGDEEEDIQANANQEPENQASLLENVRNLTASNSKLQAQVQKLVSKPEEDTPMAVVKNDGKLNDVPKHSKTHLFASDNPLNAIVPEKPWNVNAAKIKNPSEITNAATTNWNTINIDKINEEFGAYSRKNLDKIVALMRDGFSIPAHWQVIPNVSDEIAFMAFLSGEITQGKKKAWLPKNNHKFVPQKGKVYDVQIDMTWTGYELKKIEKTWLNSFFNNVASNPYKMSFVEYLVMELIKRARKEDKIRLAKGVYFPNDDMEIAGSFLNAGSGLLKLIDTKKKAGEYNAFKMGVPTPANTYDYINDFVSRLPHDIRIIPDLQLVISPTMFKDYGDGKETAKGTNTDYKGKDPYVDGYENIKFVPWPQLEGQKLIFLTTWDNINILIDKPGEESIVTFEKDKRDINAFADYKIGPHVSVFGAQMADGALVGYENQLFFSNDVEILHDVYVPVPANTATPDLQYHHSLIIGEHNTSATDITNFLNATVGEKIYLTGNTSTNKSTVKNNSNIILSGGDCELTTTTLLVLMARSDGKFVELYRTDLSVSSTAYELAVDATTADATNGTEFITQANTEATALTNITNAVDGETYIIRGGSSTNATTIANSGNFTLSAAMTLNAGTFIKLFYNGTKFIEISRG